MARPKKNQQAPFAPGGTQAGGAIIIFRERAIEGLGNSIQMLEDEANYQRQMLNNLTQGGTIGRQGKAGGFQVGRSSSTIGAAAGANAAGEGLSHPIWVLGLMREYHPKEMRAAQIKEHAVNVGRPIHDTFPHDVLGKKIKEGRVKKLGEGADATYRLTPAGLKWITKAAGMGTGVMARQGEPQTGRTKKGAGRAKTMIAGA